MPEGATEAYVLGFFHAGVEYVRYIHVGKGHMS